MGKSLIFLGCLIFSLACTRKSDDQKQSTGGSDWKAEILDSVSVDHIGKLSWSDISPDGRLFLGIDLQSREVILMDRNGEVLKTFVKSGEQPEAVGRSPFGSPKFRNASEWMLLGRNGVFLYDTKNGDLLHQIKPDFEIFSSVISMGTDISRFFNEQEAILYYTGRAENTGFYTHTEGTKMEWVHLGDGKMKGVISYPETSMFNGDKVFPIIAAMPVFTTTTDHLYLAFQNEPVLYEYKWGKWEQPSNVYPLNLKDFQISPGLDPKSIDLSSININFRDFFYGSLDKILKLEEGLVLQYRTGLENQKFEQLYLEYPDSKDLFSVAQEANKPRFAYVDLNGQVEHFEVPRNLGSLEFIDHEGFLWFSPTEEFEREYEVIYKVGLTD